MNTGEKIIAVIISILGLACLTIIGVEIYNFGWDAGYNYRDEHMPDASFERWWSPAVGKNSEEKFTL